MNHMKQPYPEPEEGSPRPLGACVIQPSKNKRRTTNTVAIKEYDYLAEKYFKLLEKHGEEDSYPYVLDTLTIVPGGIKPNNCVCEQCGRTLGNPLADCELIGGSECHKKATQKMGRRILTRRKRR